MTVEYRKCAQRVCRVFFTSKSAQARPKRTRTACFGGVPNDLYHKISVWSARALKDPSQFRMLARRA